MANDSITRINLTEAVHNEIGLSRYESSKFVEQVLELISSALIQNEQVKISKFGTFTLREKKQRIGRNPKTKEIKLISKRNVILFKASKEFKEYISKG